MKVTVFLAERAAARDGLWDFVGVGWQMTAPQFSGCVVGLVIEVPWEETSEDDRTVVVSVTGKTLAGDDVVDTPQNLTLSKTFKAHAGTVIIGAPVRGVLGCLIPAATLEPNSRYTVSVTVDGTASDDWTADFYTWGDERPQ